jgi:predicted alpha/beta-fold hydrolase
LLMAADDPVIPAKDIDALARPPALEIDLSCHGGHCGFVDGYRLESWVDREIVEDLDSRL